MTSGDEALSHTEDDDGEVTRPYYAGSREFKDGHELMIVDPKDRAKNKCRGEHGDTRNEQALGHKIKLLDGGQVLVEALELLGFQAVPLDEKHGRDEREDSEDAIAENRECGMEFDPRVAAKNARRVGTVPSGDGKGATRKDRCESGGKETE